MNKRTALKATALLPGVCMYVCMFVCMYKDMYMYMYVCGNVYEDINKGIYICMFLYMRVKIY